jgi:anhydro-N-acetylmuramic acid kinase
MSGSSLDGLDLCAVVFDGEAQLPTWNIEAFTTLHYPEPWVALLQQAPTLSGEQLMSLHHNYGVLLGNMMANFIQQAQLKPQLIGLHGHTVFHKPAEGWSLQLGQPEAIAKATGVPVVHDFRNQDMAWGGQGAPLVPRGDVSLFPGYGGWVNLGGICNATLLTSNGVVAYDVGPFNQVFNFLSHQLGMDFDRDGLRTAEGTVQPALLHQMEQWPFFHQPGPKSLSNQEVAQFWFPLVQTVSPTDGLRTFAEIMARTMAAELRQVSDKKPVMFTGGGTYHRFWMHRLQELSPVPVHFPSPQVIESKEALIFAYLAWLRWQHQPNTLHEATGATRSVSSGTIIWPG